MSRHTELYFLRSKGERILIGEGDQQITVTMDHINPNNKKAQIRVRAPKHVRIDRAERRLEIQSR